MSEWADLITAVTLLLTALGTGTAGTYKLFRDRNAEREKKLEAQRDEAIAQARLEARTEATEATVAQLQAEIAQKDRALAACDTARAELRQLLLSCREGS